MSSRVLKKLHGEPELEIKEAEEILSDIELAEGSEKKQLNNRYDLVRYIFCCDFYFHYEICFCFVLGRFNGNKLGLQFKVLFNIRSNRIPTSIKKDIYTRYNVFKLTFGLLCYLAWSFVQTHLVLSNSEKYFC